MKVFISSIIGGYEHYRAAAQEAVETLGHQAIRAEDFSATARTPQQACLDGVRASDVVVLLMGGPYGVVQPSGLSATHEEYREARERKPVLVFIESGVARESEQQAFLDEVQAWATGHSRAGFSSPDDLKPAVVRALHDHELAISSGPVDEAEMVGRARALLPRPPGMAGQALVMVAVAGGPRQQVVRPAELEDHGLARDVQREALFGEDPVLDSSEGTTVAVRGGTLILEQRAGSVSLDQAGSVRIVQPARRDPTSGRTELPALIEEDVTEAIGNASRFSGWLLDRVDPLRRLTDVVVVAHVSGAGYMAWRTRAEHAASPIPPPWESAATRRR